MTYQATPDGWGASLTDSEANNLYQQHMAERLHGAINGALDKLAENGMPFIDVVKADVERNYIATFSSPPFSISGTGAKPLPTEPVQVYEDSPFWNEARKMTDQTDRIKQMAQEAGFPGMAVDNMSPQDAERLAKFAALVAEDCARVCDERAAEMFGFTEEEHCSQELARAIRARYGLKGE